MPQLDAPRFATLGDRVRNVDELDALIENWTRTLTTDECSAQCERIGVAAGPIATVNGLSCATRVRQDRSRPRASMDRRIATCRSSVYRGSGMTRMLRFKQPLTAMLQRPMQVR
ncbi:CoA transferase [Paraburkholderia youngii]|uniref:CoA transferase n=1 Tax=Paraburkholderia youngii TaxID=2782701 RepID=UPI0034A505C6